MKKERGGSKKAKIKPSIKGKKLKPRSRVRKFTHPLPYIVLIGLIAAFFLGNLSKPANELLPPVPPDALYKQSSAPIDNRVNDLLDRMSLKEKIGQMALVEKNSIRGEDVARYNLGGILSGAGAKPRVNTPEGWLAMIEGFKKQAEKSRLAIPILYGLDAIHGHANVPGATVFPHAIGLGASNDSALVTRVAQATAEELAVTGVNWNYAPTLDAPKDIRWGRVYEAFSDDPATNSRLGVAYIQGIQSHNSTQSAFEPVLATAKHYLGTGSMMWGKSDNKNFKIDQGTTEASELLLANEYLPPFRAAIDAEVSSVMVALQKWGTESVITNRYLITEKLKGELGFKGFTVSDWYGVYERAGNKYSATVKAINAGLDMPMLPFDYKGFVRDVEKAVKNDDIEESRINDAVRRILTQKFKAGLFDRANTPVQNGVVGSATNRSVAREAVAKSAVLLKNNNVLPIDPADNSILIAGSGADNIGRQCGAWTVEWQGIDGNWLPGATSILTGIQETVKSSTTMVYDKNGDFDQGIKAKVGIVVVSEKPYAEGWGDNAEPKLDSQDEIVIKKVQAKAEKVVVVTLSGRPLILNQTELASWDGLIAAWLPGSEGAGIADVLFGARKFTGKLPIAWPASISQVPIQHDGTTSDKTEPLYRRGYGL